jgi:hypothetical protein
MKKIIKKVAMATLGIGLLAVCAEAETATSQLIWSGSWIAAMALAAYSLNKLEKEEAEK